MFTSQLYPYEFQFGPFTMMYGPVFQPVQFMNAPFFAGNIALPLPVSPPQPVPAQPVTTPPAAS
jgi:hypothetical protein